MVGKSQTILAGRQRLRMVNFRLSLPPLSDQFSVITTSLYIPLPVLSRQRSIFGSFQDTTQFLPLRPEISKPINEIRLFFQRRSGDLFLQLFYLPDHSVKILCNQADGHESTLEFLAIFFLKKELRPSGNFDIRLFKCQFNGMEDGILGVLPPDKKRFKPTSSLHIPPFILQLHRNNVLQDPSLF